MAMIIAITAGRLVQNLAALAAVHLSKGRVSTLGEQGLPPAGRTLPPLGGTLPPAGRTLPPADRPAGRTLPPAACPVFGSPPVNTNSLHSMLWKSMPRGLYRALSSESPLPEGNQRVAASPQWKGTHFSESTNCQQ